MVGDIIVFTAAFVSLLFLFLFIFSQISSKKNNISQRLTDIEQLSTGSEEDLLDKPFFTRMVKPGILKLVERLSRLTPKTRKDEIQRKLIRAGSPAGLDAPAWIFLRLVLCSALPCALFILMILNGVSKSTVLLVTLAAALILYLAPGFFLQQSIKKQQNNIVKALPDVLDLLTVSVEAGLSFDGAIAKVAEKISGPLSGDFTKLLNEIKVGKPRRDALKDMAVQSGVQDLNTFVSAIIQADQLGVSISNVLRIQSEQIREKRKQRVQEAAMKAPVKMLLPLVIFIFPTIFIILLGPAVLIFMDAFK